MLAEQHAHGVAADVGGHHGDHQAEHPPGTVGGIDQQGGEGGEQRHPAGQEDGGRRVAQVVRRGRTGERLGRLRLSCMNNRQNRQATTVTPKPANAPAAWNGQVSHTVSWPPASNGMTGMTYPASRSRRTTSWLATRMAIATIGTQKRGANTSVTMSTAPIPAPTAMAARRSRPAREVFFLARCPAAPSVVFSTACSGSSPAPGSEVATDLNQLRCRMVARPPAARLLCA